MRGRWTERRCGREEGREGRAAFKLKPQLPSIPSLAEVILREKIVPLMSEHSTTMSGCGEEIKRGPN